jgi:peptidoglycan/LPS O-acetylase OafA/YrhL
MKIKEQDAHNNFTILRLLLAVAVVFGHFQLLYGVDSPPWPYVYAGAAVDCFFVVSGYLVSLSFDRDSNFQRFYLRRFFRIYPLYLLVVIIQTFILGALADGGILANLKSMASYFAVNAVFANFVQHDIGGVLTGLANPSLNASLWTLKIEFGFYLLLPFLWLAIKRFGPWVMVAIFAASAFYFWTLKGAGQGELARQLPGQLQYFILGVAAYMYRARLNLDKRLGLILLPVLAVALTVLLPTKTPVLYPFVVAAFVVVLALKTPVFNAGNDFSFGVYLIHAPVIQVFLLSGLYRHDWIGLMMILAVTTVLAIIAERTIEIPGIALGKHLARQVGSGPVLPTTQRAGTP